jgi:hypothetical protein
MKKIKKKHTTDKKSMVLEAVYLAPKLKIKTN